MAENEKCVKRWVWSELCGEDYHDTFVDHHEWRFLREAIAVDGRGNDVPCYAYYCVFCLEYKRKEVKMGRVDSLNE